MSTTPIKPRERRHAQTRQAILDATRLLVQERGVAGLSMRAIAEQIDYSAAGLYEYFDSKEAIIGAVCEQGHQRLTAAMGAVDAALPVDHYMVGIGMAYIDFALAYPDYFNLMFTASPLLTIDGMTDDDSSYLYLLKAVERGVGEGVFRVRPGYGPQEIVYHAWALVHGIATLRTTVFRDFPSDLGPADHEVLRAFVRGLQAG